MRIALALLIALATLGRLSAGAATSGILVQGFGINNQILIELYNTASQTNQAITTWPSNMNPAVIQATVRNPGTTALRPCFVAVIQETSSGCSGYVVKSPMVKSRVEIQPGETRVLTAADFETSGNYSGDICLSFQNQLKAEFKGADAGSITKIVDKFFRRSFQICLVETDCNSGGQISGNQACTNFTLLSGSPGGAASVAMLVFPHNNEVEAGGLNFLWTPALHPQLSSGDISYLLEVLEGAGGQVIARIEVPAGQTYYQWSPSDKNLEPGKQYYWRVIARNARTGATFGGQDGRGWNIQKWFRIKGEKVGPCSYTLQDLEDYVRDHATPEVKALIKDMRAKALTSPLSFTDQDICALLNGKADLKAINATKK